MEITFWNFNPIILRQNQFKSQGVKLIPNSPAEQALMEEVSLSADTSEMEEVLRKLYLSKSTVITAEP